MMRARWTSRRAWIIPVIAGWSTALAHCTTFGSDPPVAVAADGAVESAPGDAATTGDSAPPADDDAGRADATDADLGCQGAIDCERVIFVTSTSQVGATLNGLTGADLICNKLAATAMAPRVRGRSFVAWLSGPTAAASRLVKGTQSYILPNATVVAKGFSKLASAAHDAAISIDENGAAVSGDTGVWTGSDENGQTTPATCEAWFTANAGQNGKLGRTTKMDKSWSNDGSFGCGEKHRLYCVER